MTEGTGGTDETEWLKKLGDWRDLGDWRNWVTGYQDWLSQLEMDVSRSVKVMGKHMGCGE